VQRNVLRYRRALPNGDWRLLRGPADIYMLTIFIYDVLQATGCILNIRWVHKGIVIADSYCTAQGIVQQTGELGLALATLILTLHTFVVALWSVGVRARNFAFGIVAVATLFVALWVGIGNGIHKHYETPTPYWCWIGRGFEAERLAGEYIWFWITLIASVILNISVYFWTKGHLSVNLKRMLLYPLVYAVTILPTSIARWVEFNHNVPSAAIFFSVFVFHLSGAFNVLLFLVVRPQLLLFNDPEGFRKTEVVDIGTNSTISNNTEKGDHNPQAIGAELVDDGEWVPPLRDVDVALSRIDSKPDV